MDMRIARALAWESLDYHLAVLPFLLLAAYSLCRRR
jgi:hypothetical protein